jgi:hypothetical protein
VSETVKRQAALSEGGLPHGALFHGDDSEEDPFYFGRIDRDDVAGCHFDDHA